MVAGEHLQQDLLGLRPGGVVDPLVLRRRRGGSRWGRGNILLVFSSLPSLLCLACFLSADSVFLQQTLEVRFFKIRWSRLYFSNTLEAYLSKYVGGYILAILWRLIFLNIHFESYKVKFWKYVMWRLFFFYSEARFFLWRNVEYFLVCFLILRGVSF